MEPQGYAGSSKKYATAGVKEYREMGYYRPDYEPKDSDVLAAFRVTPQSGVPFEEAADEVADEVVAHGIKERRAEAEAARADADVGGAAADVSREALDLGEGRADLVGVEVNRAAAHRQQVKLALHPGSLLFSGRRLLAVGF